MLTASRCPRRLWRSAVDSWIPEFPPALELRLAHFTQHIDDAKVVRLDARGLTCQAAQAALVSLEILGRSAYLEILGLRRNLTASHLQVLRRMLLANRGRHREMA